MKTHILIIDADQLATKMLRFLLAGEGYTVTTLDDPRGSSDVLSNHAIDLIIMDVALPWQDGFTLCAHLKQAHSDTPIILLAGHATTDDLVKGFSQGADDFIKRPYDPAVLLARIQAVLRRYRRKERGTDSVLVTVGSTHLDLGRLTFRTGSGREVLVTPTEMRLLECLMRNAHLVITREKLITQTWGYESANADNRVDVSMRRLRQKIEAHPQESTLIRTIRGVGYVYDGGQAKQSSSGGLPARDVSTMARHHAGQQGAIAGDG